MIFVPYFRVALILLLLFFACNDILGAPTNPAQQATHVEFPHGHRLQSPSAPERTDSTLFNVNTASHHSSPSALSSAPYRLSFREAKSVSSG